MRFTAATAVLCAGDAEQIFGTRFSGEYVMTSVARQLEALAYKIHKGPREHASATPDPVADDLGDPAHHPAGLVVGAIRPRPARTPTSPLATDVFCPATIANAPSWLSSTRS
jgi:hypothetical protein